MYAFPTEEVEDNNKHDMTVVDVTSHNITVRWKTPLPDDIYVLVINADPTKVTYAEKSRKYLIFNVSDQVRCHKAINLSVVTVSKSFVDKFNFGGICTFLEIDFSFY